MSEITITGLTDACELQQVMGVSSGLATKVIRFTELFRNLTGHDVEAISGYRSCRKQEMLGARGRPAAPCDVSTHTSCPATGMDFRLPGLSDTDLLKMQFGNTAVLAGLRWGGGSPERLVRVGGRVIGSIPSDWNHLDEGRRTS